MGARLCAGHQRTILLTAVLLVEDYFDLTLCGSEALHWGSKDRSHNCSTGSRL